MAKKTKMAEIGKSLGSLNSSHTVKKEPPKIQIPPATTGLTAIEKVRELFRTAKEMDEELALQVGEWIANESLPFLKTVDELIRDYGEDCLDLSSEDEESLTIRQKRDKYIALNEQYMNAIFTVEEGKGFSLPGFYVRKAAHMAVLKNRFSTKEMTRDELILAVNKSVEEGYFQTDNSGLIKIWQRKYSLSPDEKFGKMEEEEERLIAEMTDNQIRRINSEFQDEMREEAKKLEEEGEISLEELLTSKAGKCFAFVPTKILPNGNGGKKLQSVSLLLYGDGQGRISILQAIGADAKSALEIRDQKLFVLAWTLQYYAPPKIETLTSKGFTEDNAHKLRRLWNYVKRAADAQQEMEKRKREQEALKELKESQRKALEKAEEEKAKWKKETTLSGQRFFLEENSEDGVVFLEYKSQKGWRNPDGSVIPPGMLYFTIEYKEGKIRVKDSPSHLENFFNEDCKQFHAYNSENEYENLPQPLRVMMKVLSKQTI